MVLAHLRSVVGSTLFIRVCMVLWGAAFASLGLLLLSRFTPRDPLEWVLSGLLTLIMCLGAFLCCVGAAGSKVQVIEATDCMSEGGDLLGIVFAVAVALVAVPVTMVLVASGVRDE